MINPIIWMKIKSNKIEGSQFGLPFFFLPEYYVNINDIKQHYPDAFYIRLLSGFTG